MFTSCLVGDDSSSGRVHGLFQLEALKVEVMGYDDKDEAKLIARVHTRWASRSYKQGYNSYNYGYNPVIHV